MSRVWSILRRPWAWFVLAAGAVLLVVALALFQPWKLWTDVTVDEALPPGAGTAAPVTGPDPTARGAAGPAVLAEGTLISHEHETTGSVQVLRAADGTRYLRLVDLDTSNGPDLKVWLTDAPVIEGRDGWHVFDDGAHRSLGDLRGNRGSQNYAIPADLDLAAFTSVVIWCDRFNVSFGAAELRAT